MTDCIMSDEEIQAYAALLEEGTLDKIRRGIPVSSEQAFAAMAYTSTQPKPTLWQRVKRILWGPA